MIDSSAILEINTKNILHNYKVLSRIANNSISGATIKANAYGLGDLKVFNILYNIGCKHFFVATIEEALNLRKKYKKSNVYILNGVDESQIKLTQQKNLIPIINSLDQLKILNRKFKNSKHKIKIGIHIDSGINRLGIKTNNLKNNNTDNLDIYLLLSHLASSDEKNNKYNNFQNKNFFNTFKYFKSAKYKSLVNSMGVILGEKFHYDIIRPGISLYGGHYNTKLKKIIKPVIKLKARVLQIKNLEKNEYIGYNQTYKTVKSTTIAILGIGYADGISRKLSNKGKVFYKKKKFNIIGRVSMDSTTIDITKYKTIIKKGIYMELINHKYDIEKMAKECDTISNEILTSISNRVKRNYI